MKLHRMEGLEISLAKELFYAASQKNGMNFYQQIISNPVASELLPKARTRQCRFPTINRGSPRALPCPLYHSGATGIDITRR
jgi:hypothetical protein